MQFIYTLITYKKLQQNLWRTQTINNTLCLPYKVDHWSVCHGVQSPFIPLIPGISLPSLFSVSRQVWPQVLSAGHSLLIAKWPSYWGREESSTILFISSIMVITRQSMMCVCVSFIYFVAFVIILLFYHYIITVEQYFQPNPTLIFVFIWIVHT